LLRDRFTVLGMSMTTLLAVNMLDAVEMVAMWVRGDASKKGGISTGAPAGERLFPLIGQVYVFTLAAVGSGVYYGYVYAQIAAREIVTANPRVTYDPWVPVRTYLPYTLPVAATVGFLAVVLASALPCLTARSGAHARSPDAIKAAAAAAGFKSRFMGGGVAAPPPPAVAGGGAPAGAAEDAEARVGSGGGGGGADSDAEPLLHGEGTAALRGGGAGGGGSGARLPRPGSGMGSVGVSAAGGASPHPFHAVLAGGSTPTPSPLAAPPVSAAGGGGAGGSKPAASATVASGVLSRRGLGVRPVLGSAGAIATAAM
jgi:hypothetical protein